MIKYYIRQLDFFYSDEASYAVDGLMNLTESYATFAEADAKCWALQQRAFQGMQLDDWQPISSINSRTPALEERWNNINNYILQEFDNGSFLELDEYRTKQTGEQKYVPRRGYYLPGNLTVQQAKKLTELTTIELFKVVEVDEAAPPFFGVYRLGNYGQTKGWVKIGAVRMGPNGYEEAQIPIVFADKAQLLEGNKDLLYSAFREVDVAQLSRPLAELSDTPTLLKAYAATLKWGISVNDKEELLVEYTSSELIGLNTFLRTKLFELRPLPLATVMMYRGYQAMQ